MISVRAGTPEDREKIDEVRGRAWKKAYASILPADVIEEATSNSRSRGMRGGIAIADEVLQSRRIFVAVEADQILGFVAGGLPIQAIPGADCEIYALYVDPDRQRCGAGRKLVIEFMQAMKSAGFQHMALWALEENYLARAFYESLGGQLQEKRKPFQWHDREVAQEVCYFWAL